MHHGMGGMGCPTCGCGMGHKMGGGIKAMFMIIPWKIILHSDELGLSDEQLDAFRSRYAEAQKQMVQIGSQIKMNMIDVQNAVMREEIDMPTAEAKIRDIGRLKSDLYVGIVQAMNDMRHILTPGQHKKVKQMLMSWLKKSGMCGMGGGEEGESGEMPEE